MRLLYVFLFVVLCSCLTLLGHTQNPITSEYKLTVQGFTKDIKPGGKRIEADHTFLLRRVVGNIVTYVPLKNWELWIIYPNRKKGESFLVTPSEGNSNKEGNKITVHFDNITMSKTTTVTMQVRMNGKIIDTLPIKVWEDNRSK